MDNRRAFARFAVRIADELMWGSGAPGAVCTIIDLSEGARAGRCRHHWPTCTAGADGAARPARGTPGYQTTGPHP